MDKTDSNFPVEKMGSLFVSTKRKRRILKTLLTPFVEPCIVSDPNLPGASPPERQVKLVSRMMGNYLLRFGEDSAFS